MINYASINEFVSMLLFWALGLYVLTRSPRSLLSGIAAATLFSVALWFFGSVMRDKVRDLDEWKAWGGFFWWAAGAALALWYWKSALALRRYPEITPASYRNFLAYPLGVLAVFAAIGFGLASVVGDSMLVWSEPVPDPRTPSISGSWAVRSGSHFAWFAVFAYATVVVSAIHLLWGWRRTPKGSGARSQLRWLTVSGSLFVVAVGWLTTNTLLDAGFPHLFGGIQPGYVVLTAGLVILGWSVVRHGTWIEGQPVQGDFAYFLVGQGLLVVLYVSLFAFVRLPIDIRSLILFLTLGLLTLSTHALADLGRITLGRLFYRRTPGKWRALERLLNYAREVSRASDHARVLQKVARESEEEWWYEQTERALRCLRDPHGLSQLDIVQSLDPDGASPLDRARRSGDVVVGCINKLEPGDGRPPPRPFVILKEAYVEGRSTKEIMSRHQIPEKTYYNERKKGVAAIAAELRALARA